MVSADQWWGGGALAELLRDLPELDESPAVHET